MPHKHYRPFRQTVLRTVCAGDDIVNVLDTFSEHDLARLPVTVAPGSGKVIGLIRYAALMKRYRATLAE